MEEKRNLSKKLYIIELKLLKILPVLIALIYFTNTVLSVLNIDLYILSYVGSISFIPLIFMYVSSYAFKFCEYHRLPLHYIVLNNILSILSYKISFGSWWFWGILHIILFGITMFVILYLYLKSRSNEKCCNNNT